MKKGQILLITVMILATVLTVVLSVSFRSVTETQVTKLEEENQKALSAAEAAIEEALKTNLPSTLGFGGLTDFGSFSGGAEIVNVTSNSFTSPVIAKDNSYTFYLGNFNTETGQFSGNSKAEDLEICFKSTLTVPALEITLIKTSGITKYVVDPESRISNPSSGLSTICSNSSYNYSFSGVTGANIDNNSRLLIVRVLYQGTRLYFKRNSNLPQQGRTVSSSVVSNNGVSKKVTLFQTYPQIPAEFFNTTF